MADDFTLYLLMRKDMESFEHTGKMIAQGAHAANHAAEAIGSNQFGLDAMTQFAAWQKQTPQGFGTTIVFGGRDSHSGKVGLTIEDIRIVVANARRLNIPAAVINDPGYPLRDGETMHAFPCDTCGWLFGSKADVQQVTEPLVLHPENAAWPSENRRTFK
jgi:peptidyl-tRNA hydrolase